MLRIYTLAAALCAALVVAAPAAPATGTLNGVDGPGFTITLKKGGVKVTSLRAGTYRVVVADKSNIHNFHLIGPGVNVKTSVPFVGSKSFTVRLQKGKTYRFICDPHATTMKGSFKVPA